MVTKAMKAQFNTQSQDMENEEAGNRQWSVHCPVCGLQLAKCMSASMLDLECKRCKSTISVIVEENKVTVYEKCAKI